MRSSLLFIILVVGLPRHACGQQNTSNLSGGATVQRQRIDRAIETARALSVDDAIASLSQYNESYELAKLAELSPSSLGSCFMKSMLADRRISKIFEYLMSLPVAEADAKAQQIFDDQFAIFLKEWRNFAKQRGLPGTGPPHHAASAGLLMCSYFCSKETLDEKILRWNDTIRQPEFEYIIGVKYISSSRLIDRLFHLNLLVISGQRHKSSMSQLDPELKSLCQKISGSSEKPFLQVTQMRMFKWSAETLDTDFTHLTRGIPSSDDSVLLEVPGFADPNSSMRIQNTKDADVVAQQFLNCVRTWRDR